MLNLMVSWRAALQVKLAYDFEFPGDSTRVIQGFLEYSLLLTTFRLYSKWPKSLSSYITELQPESYGLKY